jgi:hypothetical protein
MCTGLRVCFLYVEIKCQLDTTDVFLLQILLLVQHVSGTIMPIVRRSRVLYRWLLSVVFNALVFKLSVWCGAEGCVSGYHLYNTLDLLMMGIMVPETCWTSNKICNKKTSVASSWHFISTYYRRCTVKATSNKQCTFNVILRHFGVTIVDKYYVLGCKVKITSNLLFVYFPGVATHCCCIYTAL